MYPSKHPDYVRAYQKSVPIELKRHYEKIYLATEKGKLYKREKNRRYREKQKLLKLTQDNGRTRTYGSIELPKFNMIQSYTSQKDNK